MAEWIIDLIQQYGYPAVAALMFLENIFPPLPSELIMPFAGFVGARGKLDPFWVVLCGTFGSLAGTIPWYFAGRAVGIERMHRWAGRHGRWLAVSQSDLASAQAWFERRGALAVALGRLVPALRSVISTPAGIARMPIQVFLLWSAVGSLIWTSLLAGIGYLLKSRYEQVVNWLDPVSKIIVAAAMAACLRRVLTFKRRTSASP
ncbi:MAG: alkaline phosphatase [Burkholderiales bacterium 28-67-8]|nr:MAG: alkaline phosphatase [Burkholderiales bacterium 28-67-8]